ncbi:VirB8/TrbF family protein [Pseudodesulfovibrio tunisiensis]|uniref:VirB8/TrbF family protein n=1 Tax=Pseudodesulfovibrio tunisiensis TaxID=463192 RepID=UPI001FB2B1B5|nr:VirB8/TrbF family protein [Pseudodesulfovibrio tunisiensis]
MSKQIENPYLAGREEWLERYGSYIRSRNLWRMFAFGCLTVAGLSIAGNVVQATRNRVVPYVVEVDKLGNARAVQRAEAIGEIPDRVIQADLARFVTNWRTVTADLGLQKRMVTRLSAYVAGSAKGMIREWFMGNNPYERAKDVLVEVTIAGIPLPVSDSSWRIEWAETVRSHAGTTLSHTRYEATLTVAVHPPKTDRQIISNPAGVFVTGLSWAELLGQKG